MHLCHFLFAPKINFLHLWNCRKCNESQVFVKDSLTHCIDTCKEKTMCGEVEVPEQHLDACRVCNTTGQDCKIEAGSKPGEGKICNGLILTRNKRKLCISVLNLDC